MVKLPSIYDSFYINKKILDDFPIEEIELREDTYKGIIYFYELLLLNIIRSLEDKNPDESFRDILNFEGKPTNLISKYGERNQIMQSVFNLNAIRKKIARFRYPENKPRKSVFIDNLKEAREICQEVDSKFRRDHIVRKLDLPKKEVKNRFTSKIHSEFQYITKESHSDNEEKSVLKGEVHPAYPGDGGWVSWQNNTTSNYNLQKEPNRKIRKELLNGYKKALYTLYKVFSDENLKALLKVNKWSEINSVKPTNVSTYKALFETDINRTYTLPESIETHLDLEFLFRSRHPHIEVRDLKEDARRKSDFQTIFLGTVQQFGEETLLIELEMNKRGVEYSYILRNPHYSSLSNHSMWYFFDTLGFVDPWRDTVTTHVQLVRNLAEKHNVKLHQIEADKEVVEEFIAENSPQKRKEKKQESLIQDLKGLFGELIGNIYLQKEYNAVIKYWNKNLKTDNIDVTDIDVLAETENRTFLLQAKSSLTSLDIPHVVNHFKTVEEEYQVDEKILFVLSLFTHERDQEEQAEEEKKMFTKLEEQNISVISLFEYLEEIEKLGGSDLKEKIRAVYSRAF